MIVYFADRQLNISGHASTQLESGYTIVEDTLTEEISTGVNTFSLKVFINDGNRQELEKAAQVGNFVLRSGGRAFTGKENQYSSLYQIVETEYDSSTRELSIYAEDAGLELLNKTCAASEQKNKTLEAMLKAFVPSDWVINLIETPTGTKSNTWDGDSTATERINSVVSLFGCEIYYSFIIERLQVSKKVINVIPKRGTQKAVEQLRLNYHINSIQTKTSIADLATAFEVKGGTPEKSDKPIDLKGYTYSYTDATTGDVYTVDKATGQMRNTTAMKRWASSIDTDGLIIRAYSFDTTDKAVLAGEARAELQKCSQPTVEYEVDFATLPEDIRLGDRINIIDDEGKLYLDARVLKLESSVVSGSQKATLGEYIVRSAGISAKVADLASQLSNLAKTMLLSIEIVSSNGNVFISTTVATTLTAKVTQNGAELTDSEVANLGTIRWYNYDDRSTVLATGKTFTITESMNIDAVNIIARLEA